MVRVVVPTVALRIKWLGISTLLQRASEVYPNTSQSKTGVSVQLIILAGSDIDSPWVVRGRITMLSPWWPGGHPVRGAAMATVDRHQVDRSTQPHTRQNASRGRQFGPKLGAPSMPRTNETTLDSCWIYSVHHSPLLFGAVNKTSFLVFQRTVK